MIFIFVFLLCAVNSDAANEGDNCSKEGVAGVCTNIRKCLAVQQDIENRIEPQICNFLGVDPIVCCVPPVTTTTATTTTTTTTERPKGKCILPPYPKHGTYTTNVAKSMPGDDYDIFVINTTCRRDYTVAGTRTVFCQDGWWTAPMPTCVRNSQCHVMPHKSLVYNCIVAEDGKEEYDRDCEEYEPPGTLVKVRCWSPRYKALPIPVNYMRCVDGSMKYESFNKYNRDIADVIVDELQESSLYTVFAEACKRSAFPY